MSKVEIVEVGPRDGLQNESQVLNVAARLDFVRRLSSAGLKRIEVGAFVSPHWVPQMQGTAELVSRILDEQANGQHSKSIRFSALVPNPRGMQDALKFPLKEVAIFGACTESFSQKNINCSIDESFVRFKEVCAMAKKARVKVRGYLSMAFGCPYEGKVAESTVVSIAKRMKALGVYELSIGDTIGAATPAQVRSLVKKLKAKVGAKILAMHFHDTRGQALANVLAAYDLGIRVFDSSLGGLGGCPYAKGASGNLATEDLVYMFKGMKVATGVDIAKLIALKSYMEGVVGRKLPSRVGAAGLPLPGTVFE